MDAERNKMLFERATCDSQYEAPVLSDNEGKVLINCQLAQSLMEMEE